MDEAIELAIEERDRNHGGLARKFAHYLMPDTLASTKSERESGVCRACWVSSVSVQGSRVGDACFEDKAAARGTFAGRRGH
jgi:hypothetical protein